jgi:universal stress protein A
MTSIDKILVPVDFQSDPKTVLQLAVELGRAHNARLVFLHVIDQPIIDAIHQVSHKGYKGEFVQGMRKLVQDKERDLENLIPETYREGLDVELLVRKGDPAEKIIQVAKDLSIKLIVLGSSALEGETAFHIGEVARRVMSGAPCSLLLARPTEDIGAL